MEKHAKQLAVAPERVLSKAVCRAADYWSLTQEELAALLGTSPASVSRLRHGQRLLAADSTELQLAALVVRIFRSLDSLVGEAAKAAAWLRADNRHLRGVPLELMKSITGMVNVAEYLDAMRGKV